MSPHNRGRAQLHCILKLDSHLFWIKVHPIQPQIMRYEDFGTFRSRLSSFGPGLKVGVGQGVGFCLPFEDDLSGIRKKILSNRRGGHIATERSQVVEEQFITTHSCQFPWRVVVPSAKLGHGEETLSQLGQEAETISSAD